jgi:hypothetical protein
MAKKRRKNSKSTTSKDFLKLLVSLAILGGLIWFWQHKNAPKHSHPKEAPPPPVAAPVKPESEKAKPPPETQETKSAKTLSGLFPPETWQDDYLQVPISFGDEREGLLASIGIAPPGKNPDGIRDPDQLRPALIVAKKVGESFVRQDFFDFSTPIPTQGGIRGSDLRGIARVTLKSLIDLDHDGTYEIVAGVDTVGDFAQAIAFLRFHGNRLEWIKTLDKSGKEKIALWLTGSTSIESEDVMTKKAEGGKMEVIHKKGELDPKQPQKGFVWTETHWVMKNGMLVEK